MLRNWVHISSPGTNPVFGLPSEGAVAPGDWESDILIRSFKERVARDEETPRGGGRRQKPEIPPMQLVCEILFPKQLTGSRGLFSFSACWVGDIVAAGLD